MDFINMSNNLLGIVYTYLFLNKCSVTHGLKTTQSSISLIPVAPLYALICLFVCWPLLDPNLLDGSAYLFHFGVKVLLMRGR